MTEKNTKNINDYWEYRASLSYKYKGETFYTVTPIPYYYRRRTILLDLIDHLFKPEKITDICDFGCGDGWYIHHFAEKYPSKYWHGIDISRAMIERARQICPFAELVVSHKGITFEKHFDLVYAIAVFAHVPDDTLETLFANIYHKLKPQGRFVFFEATGSLRTEGTTWFRRTTEEYIEFATKWNFEIESRHLISYPFHRFFEKKLLPYYCRVFTSGNNSYERCINANRSWFFRLLSAMILQATRNPLREDDGRCDGNTLYITKRA